MSQGPVLGIDLGTTNSVVAVADGGQTRILTDLDGRRMVPSVVSFHPSGETLVGYEARERRLVDAENTVYAVKRLIGRPFDSPEVSRARERFGFKIVENKHGGTVVEVRRGTYALAEISAMVLRQLRRLAEASLGVPCERAVVTVPANFNELQRSATKAAGKVAGLDVLRILNEPTAAALAYGLGKGRREKIAVYDLGGGTFDFTILDLDDDVFEVLATAGDTFLGGEDLDDAVGEAMADHFMKEHHWDPREDRQAFERLKAAGEWTKCQLSEETVVELTVEALFHGEGGKPLDLDFALTREELNVIARPWLERSFVVCDAAMQTAGLRTSDIGSVALVGGSTRMPLVHEMVEAYFGMKPRTDVDPDMVVAQGAAIHGYAIGGPAEPVAPVKPEKKRETIGRVMLKKVARPPPPKRRKSGTIDGMPGGPAFAPMEGREAKPPPERPKRQTAPPPPMPDLPPTPIDGPAVVSSPTIEIRTPRTTLDGELDLLSPPSDMPTKGDLDDLAPPAFAPDPFGDVDPFAIPDAGSTVAKNPVLGPPDALPPPTRRNVPSREPTTPFVIEEHGPPPKSPPRPPPKMPMAAPPPPPASRPIRAPVGLPREAPAAPKRPAVPKQPEAPAQPVLAQAVVPMPETAPPILMDITPHSLGLETAGGYCRRLILKNAPLPTEQTRTFTTAKDDQSEVAVRICQGESETFADNDVLGEIILDDLPAKARGELQIEVTFILDANGTLSIEAKDADSGRIQKTRIELSGGLSDMEIASMRLRLDAEDL